MSFHVSDNNYSLSIIFAVAGKQDPKMIKCYHESSGGKFQHCMKDDGFETCFSKFDHSKSFHSKTIDCKKTLQSVFCKKIYLQTQITGWYCAVALPRGKCSTSSARVIWVAQGWKEIKNCKNNFEKVSLFFLRSMLYIKINMNGTCPLSKNPCLPLGLLFSLVFLFVA